MNQNGNNTALTPPQLAKRWGVSPEQVISLIRAGKLRGFNVSLPGKRPRFRIGLDAIAEYETRGECVTPAKPARRKRRKRDEDFVRYFS